MGDLYFFGCHRESDHFLFEVRDDGTLWSARSVGRWKWTDLDGTLAPKHRAQPEGLAEVHRVDGWTAVAFWDRSVDGRRNSNAAIILRGEHDLAHVLEVARRRIPNVMARFKFEIREENMTPEQERRLRQAARARAKTEAAEQQTPPSAGEGADRG